MIGVRLITITAAENGGFVLHVEREWAPHITLVATDLQQLNEMVASIKWTNAKEPVRAGGA